ncbi:MAG: hypothetical protein JWQ17_3465 [Tardiphaga sp.]|nr:hypothetical protein [Tardiphaga sp.]
MTEQHRGPTMNSSTDFIVARDEFALCKFIETSIPSTTELPDEALLVKIDRFAFTANNITYAMLGDQLKYWQLFPAPDGFGNIPVWGFGRVIASKHPQVSEGELLFGYFPMATHLVMEAADVGKRGLRDGAAHRQGWHQSTTPMRASATIQPSPAVRAITRRCCGRCSCCRFWSTIFWRRTRFTARAA